MVERDKERILVIRFSSLGDILLTAPALRALRTRFPESHIDFLVSTGFADAARLLSGADRVLTFDKRSGFRGLCALRSQLSRRYAIIVDIQNNTRSVFLRSSTFPVFCVKAKRYRLRRWLFIHWKWNLYHQPRSVALRYLDAAAFLGAVDDGHGLLLAVPPPERVWAENFSPCEPTVVLCPGSRHFTKRWPVEYWIELGQRFHENGNRVLLVGAADECDLLRSISAGIEESAFICDRTIPEVAALLERAAVVVSNDSGLMHLAAGVGTPLVALFGPTIEQFGFYPFRSTAEVMEQTLCCRPCSAMGSSQCPKSHFRCMKDTKPAMVYLAAQRVMKTIPE